MPRQIVENSILTILQQGLGQGIRLVGNLILTRLLFPEAFGLISLVIVFSSGISMFSDLGITPSVVYHKNAYDKKFLMTAWTLKIIRGWALLIVACILSYPIATFYEQPDLMFMIPVFIIAECILGFRSITCALFTKDLRHGPLFIEDLVAQVIGLTCTIILAYYYRSVWALVFSGIIASAVRLMFSFTYIRGIKHSFCWDPESRKELIKFGRWILVSTVLAYLISQGDRMVIGKLFTLKELGIYAIAYNFSHAFSGIMETVAKKVIFPVYAKFGDGDEASWKEQVSKIKLGFLAASVLPIVLLVVGGPWLIEFLYDPRYHDAGMMLRILAFSSMPMTLCSILRVVLLAKGNSHRHMWSKFFELILMVLGLFVGAHLGGLQGLIIGYVVATFLIYPICVISAFKYRAWNPSLEIGYIILCSGLCVFGIYFF